MSKVKPGRGIPQSMTSPHHPAGPPREESDQEHEYKRSPWRARPHVSRRYLLGGIAASLSTVAGCGGMTDDTSTPSPTSPTATTSTPTPTSSPEQPTASPSHGALALTPLETYTNEEDGFRMIVPENWTVDASTPSDRVVFLSPAQGSLVIDVFGDLAYQPGTKHTLNSFADRVIATLRGNATRVAALDRHSLTLQSGHPARLIDITFETSEYDRLRSYLLLAKQDPPTRRPVFYRLQFTADAPDWTPTVERTVRRLVTSFTLL